MMKDIMNKLTSRKFLLAVIGVISSLAMTLGVEGNEIMDVVARIAGVLATANIIRGYENAEAKVDAAREAAKGKDNE